MANKQAVQSATLIVFRVTFSNTRIVQFHAKDPTQVTFGRYVCLNESGTALVQGVKPSGIAVQYTVTTSIPYMKTLTIVSHRAHNSS